MLRDVFVSQNIRAYFLETEDLRVNLLDGPFSCSLQRIIILKYIELSIEFNHFLFNISIMDRLIPHVVGLIHIVLKLDLVF